MGYQVVIIGTGPGRLFAAMQLAQEGMSPVRLLDQVPDPSTRHRDQAGGNLRGEAALEPTVMRSSFYPLM